MRLDRIVAAGEITRFFTRKDGNRLERDRRNRGDDLLFGGCVVELMEKAQGGG
jgi:hypothetical protein